MGVHNLNDKPAFEANIIQEKGLVLLDCFATWCGPCKAVAPKIVEFSNDPKYADVKFYKLDVDEVEDVAADLKISAMPTFIFFRDGKPIEKIVGADVPQIVRVLDRETKAAAAAPAASANEGGVKSPGGTDSVITSPTSATTGATSPTTTADTEDATSKTTETV